MKRHFHSFLLLTVFWLCQALVTESVANDFEIYYFKQSVPLQLDTTRVAVWGDARPAESLAAMGRLGFSTTGVAVHPIKGWQLVGTDKPLGARAELTATLDRIGNDNTFEFATPVFFDSLGGPFFPTRDILVRFQKEVDEKAARKILETANIGTVLDENWANMQGAYRIRSNSVNGLAVMEQANALAQKPEVRWAEPDMTFTGRGDAGPGSPPDDTFFSSCWGLHNTGQSLACLGGSGVDDMDMDALEAWDITTGDPNILVLVMDTGVQQDHPDLTQLPGADFTTDNGDGGPVNECDNHGTPVAGCVSATINNALGTVGVAPDCNVVSARLFISSSSCNGGWNGSYSWGVAALSWAESIGVRVTNNSNIYGGTSASLADKYAETRANGMVHFASAGNDGSATLGWPSSLSSVNAIAALDPDGTLSSFSQYGPGLAFSAPGRQVATTDRTGAAGYANGDYACVLGTSFASPYAAGVAALILSANPSLNAFEVEQIMRDSSVDLGAPGYDQFYGWGFVNAHESVLEALPTITVSPESLVATKGVLASGTIAELQQSDNADVTIRRNVAAVNSITEFELTGTSSITDPARITFGLEGSVFARSSVNQTISLFDHTTGAWVPIFMGSAARFNDSTVTASATGELARFIGDGGLVRARVTYQSDSMRQNFSSNTDHANWEITGF